MPKLTIRTKNACWVIPANVEVVKSMISQRQLCPTQICFASSIECQRLVRQLSLLALKDECEHQAPSVIAELSRRLVAQSSCNLL